MDRPYDDLGGVTDIPGPYRGCWHRACLGCGAKPNALCTFVSEQLVDGRLTRVVKNRHHPCIVRTKSEA